MFDWYAGAEQLWPVLKPHVPAEVEILEIGCGNSPMAEYLWAEAGLRRLQCIDFSAPCIEQMRRRAEERSMGIVYRTMDVRALDYAAKSFAIVIDKVCVCLCARVCLALGIGFNHGHHHHLCHYKQAGSDALYNTGAEEMKPDFAKMTKELYRVLTDDGLWLVVTRKIPPEWFAPFRVRVDIALADEERRLFHVYVLEKPRSSAAAAAETEVNATTATAAAAAKQP